MLLLVLQLGLVLAATIAEVPAAGAASDQRVELDTPSAAPKSAKAPRSVFARSGGRAQASRLAALPALLAGHATRTAVKSPAAVGGLLKVPFALISTFRGPIGKMLARLRLTAFTSEVGESLRPVIPGWQVACAYGVSWLYVFIDVAVRGAEQWASAPGDPARLTRLITYTSIFHTVATMLIPAVLIHAAVHGVQHLVRRYAVRRGLLALFATWLPTFVGIALIPAMLLFDHPVEMLLDKLFAAVWPVRDEPPPRDEPQPRDEPHAPRGETSWDRAQSPGGWERRWESK